MARLLMKKQNLGMSELIEVDDSLCNHGGVGIDFWLVKNGCSSELFTISVEDGVRLRNWLTRYLDNINY